MKICITAIPLLFFCSQLCADNLLQAISVVESNKNDYAIGDGGKALGRYQIHVTYVNDVNRIYKTSFTAKDRTDPVKSKRIVELYLNHYSKRYEKITGRKATNEVKARIHNGGPNGWKKVATLKYWAKVKKEIGGK